jgi:hypothetical protein
LPNRYYDSSEGEIEDDDDPSIKLALVKNKGDISPRNPLQRNNLQLKYFEKAKVLVAPRYDQIPSLPNPFVSHLQRVY